MPGLSAQPRSTLFLEPLDDRADSGLRIVVVQGAFSILQNNPERKALLFI
jgi:hypothetical protein